MFVSICKSIAPHGEKQQVMLTPSSTANCFTVEECAVAPSAGSFDTVMSSNPPHFYPAERSDWFLSLRSLAEASLTGQNDLAPDLLQLERKLQCDTGRNS